MALYPVVIVGSAPVNPVKLVFRSNGLAMDISTATTREVILTRSDKTSVTRVFQFLTDGTDGFGTYRLVADDTAPLAVPVVGRYSIQARVSNGVFDETTLASYFYVRAS